MDYNSGEIDIVLATYNGSKYLEQQLISITSMTGFDELVRNIIVCDDNSKDDTLAIAVKNIPKDKLIILRNTLGKPYGPAKNFERGIAVSTAEYVMLSDQDDCWEKDKLITYYEEASKFNNKKPLLIFSDLEVVNSELKKIDSSFLKYQSVDHKWAEKLNNLLIQNIAPGCTMMFNKSLIQASMPFPEKCLMHDWWLMLVCRLYGEIRFIEGKTFIKYRQHGSNQVGAKKNSIITHLLNLTRSINIASKNLIGTINQMQDFKSRYENDLPNETKNYIEAQVFVSNVSSNRYERIIKALKVKMHKSTITKTVGTYFLIFKGLNK
ncbi:TPA: glycosyltransferase family 2 protein [Enterobacter cloacae]